MLSRFLQMFVKELSEFAPSVFCCRVIVRRTFVTEKTVIGIAVNFQRVFFLKLLETRFNLLDAIACNQL